MTSSDRPLIPFKGTILASVAACVGLWSLGVRVEKFTASHGNELAALKQQLPVEDAGASIAPIDLGSTDSIEDQLEPYMPLAGLNLGALGGPKAEGTAGGARSAVDSPATPPTADEVRAARPPGWTYPAFDAPAEGRHGPPAGELPRNVHFQVVDDAGAPLAHDSLRVSEQTVDGNVPLKAYRSSNGRAGWTFGVRRLMTGSAAYFLVETEVAGQTFTGTLMLRDVGVKIDIDAGNVKLAVQANAD